MAQLLAANNAVTTLASPISNTAVSLTVATGAGALFPNPSGSQYFVLSLWDAATGTINEIMWCTARSGDTMTVVRGQEGTTAVSWLAGDNVNNFWTAGSFGAFAQLGTTFGAMNRQFITTSGTYTPSANMVYCEVRAQGAGGGGGGVGSPGPASAGAGAAGEYRSGFYSASTIGASQTVSIGAGGAAGNTSGTNGTAGGNTTFGNLITAIGGSYGAGVATTGEGGGGLGGTGGSGGSLAIPGSPGGNGIANTDVIVPSTGASSHYGAGGLGTTTTPTAALGWGSGGAGANTTSGTNQAGTAGTSGCVEVIEYIAYT